MALQHVAGKNKGHIVLYALSTCPWCRKTKKLLEDLGVDNYFGDVDLMNDAEKKEAFKAGPERYATIDLAAGGDCVVTLAEEKRKQPGFAEFAAWHNGLLYRFAGPDQLKKFLEDPDKYAVKESAP